MISLSNSKKVWDRAGIDSNSRSLDQQSDSLSTVLRGRVTWLLDPDKKAKLFIQQSNGFSIFFLTLAQWILSKKKIKSTTDEWANSLAWPPGYATFSYSTELCIHFSCSFKNAVISTFISRVNTTSAYFKAGNIFISSSLGFISS